MQKNESVSLVNCLDLLYEYSKSDLDANHESWNEYKTNELKIRNLERSIQDVKSIEEQKKLRRQITLLKNKNQLIERHETCLLRSFGVSHFYDLIFINMEEILKTPSKLMGFYSLVHRSGRNLSISLDEINIVSMYFSQLPNVTFKTQHKNDYDYENQPNCSEIAVSMLREFDVCFEIYKQNGVDGLSRLIHLFDFDLGMDLLYKFLEDEGPYPERYTIGYDLTKKCLLHLTSSDQPYPGVCQNTLKHAIYFNHSFFVVDEKTRRVYLRDPETLASRLQPISTDPFAWEYLSRMEKVDSSKMMQKIYL